MKYFRVDLLANKRVLRTPSAPNLKFTSFLKDKGCLKGLSLLDLNPLIKLFEIFMIGLLRKLSSNIRISFFNLCLSLFNSSKEFIFIEFFKT